MSASCSACRGQCCYNATVRVSGDDVRRIRMAQRIPPASFLRLVPDDGRARDRYRLGVHVSDAAGPQLLALQHSNVVKGACCFLLLLADHQPCGIYADRPTVCRVYPMRARGDAIEVRDDVICRSDYWDTERLDPQRWRTLIRRQDEEWRRYEQVVASWNASAEARSDTSFAAYLEYLDRIYELGEAGAALHPGV